MLRCPVACPDCGQPSVRGSRFCEAHLVNNSAVARRRDYNKERAQNDTVYQMYRKMRWRRFRDWLWRQNVICQLLRGGVQCTNVSKIAHHLVSPRQRPELFVEASNVVMLCPHCHPDSDGTPHWREGVDFVATKFSAPTF